MAYEILLRVEQEDSYASELLHSPSYASLSPADHGLATELVMGVLRWRSVLDDQIAEVSSQRVAKLDPEVLTALRLGVYQLTHLDRIPARAALHESVELVKRARKRSAVPFANAVLRKLSNSDPPAPGIIANPVLDVESLARTMAHPQWIVARWARNLGIDTTSRLCAYNQSIPDTAIRVRLTSAEHLLQRDGVRLEPGVLLSSARRVVAGDVTKTTAYALGQIAIQDEASQLVASLVGKGAWILDCCAAPGGKTWAIADQNPNAQIVAVELHAHRVDLLRKRVTAPNVEIRHGDICELPSGQLFDRVLVDAPCSGTGTLARNPEIKWRLRAADLDELHARQVAITEAAMRHVSMQGRLIYSTCSLEPEENEAVIRDALRLSPSFRVLPASRELEILKADGYLAETDLTALVTGDFVRTTPGVQICDGFFVAILERMR